MNDNDDGFPGGTESGAVLRVLTSLETIRREGLGSGATAAAVIERPNRAPLNLRVSADELTPKPGGAMTLGFHTACIAQCVVKEGYFRLDFVSEQGVLVCRSVPRNLFMKHAARSA